MIWSIVLGVLFFGLGAILVSNKVVRVRTVVIDSKKIDRDFSFVFVSDFHIGRDLKRKELVKIIKMINEIDGDFLLIGGDMVGKSILKYYKEEELKEILDSFRIKKRFFVKGNHDDYGLSFYDNFRVLDNEVIDLGGNVSLVGLSWVKGACLDYKLDRERFNVLLSHYPDRVMEYSKVDLALGAHSHGKQINVPLLRLDFHKEKYKKGLYKLGEDKCLYVNSGLGFSFLRIRFFSFREIVKIVLRKC